MILSHFPSVIIVSVIILNVIIMKIIILNAIIMSINIQCVVIIEIGLEQAPFVFLFFSAFKHVKSLLIMGPNNIKNSSLKCYFHIISYE